MILQKTVNAKLFALTRTKEQKISREYWNFQKALHGEDVPLYYATKQQAKRKNAWSARAGLFLAKENTVVGFDVSRRAVKQAALRARRFGAVNFCGVIGDGDHLPFKYGCFDVCLSSWTLHHFPNVGEIIRSLRGLLRKRGLLVIIEPDEESVLMRLSRLVEETWKPLVIQSGLDTPNKAIHFSKEYIALARQENLEVVNQGSYYQAELISIPKDVTGLKKAILLYAIGARHALFTGGMKLSPRIGGQALLITARARGD